MIYFDGGEKLYESYDTETVVNVSGNVQFYRNMRYRDKRISYSIEDSCNLGKISDAENAFSVLGEKTVLEFRRVDSGADIEIFCSELAPTVEEKSHFIAGEGGPSEVITSGEYSVIFLGKVSLFRIDRCDRPQIAIHEILHALGFDHNANESSILYPVTDCKQEIDDYIIEKINSLYLVKPEADLVIVSANAKKVGRYLDFEIAISNFGLKDAGKSKLEVVFDNEPVREFELEDLKIGTERTLDVENVRLPFRSGENIGFVVEYEGEELSKANNIIVLSVK